MAITASYQYLDQARTRMFHNKQASGFVDLQAPTVHSFWSIPTRYVLTVIGIAHSALSFAPILPNCVTLVGCLGSKLGSLI